MPAIPYRLSATLLSATLLLLGCATQPVPQPSPEPPPQPAPDIVVSEEIPSVEPPPPPPVEKKPAPPVYQDVWARMRSRFYLPDCDTRSKAKQWATWYANHQDYLNRVFSRAEPWLFFIVEELEQRGMPAELALLPIVESAYDPFAYSRGNAVGLWQFISGTAKDFGLQQNSWYDGRRDVYAATEAALSYLQYLGNLFDDDWFLALAAYNAGQGRMLRLRKTALRKGRPADYWSLPVPKETAGYVPKLMGLACIIKRPYDYDLNLPVIPNQAYITTVDTGTQTDLVLAAQLAELPVERLFYLNPGFNRWATPPDGPHRLVMPISAAEAFRRKLNRRGNSSLMQWDRVMVKSGDTLGALARKHGVPVQILRSANRLNKDLIRPGQALRIPRSTGLSSDELYAKQAHELERLQGKLIAADRVMHRLRPGESLSTVAKRYRVSVAQLQRWNGIKNPHRVRAGKRLIVFRQPGASAKRSADSHVVKSGESLWTISRRYKISMNDLMRQNGLNQRSILRPGQVLRINK